MALYMCTILSKFSRVTICQASAATIAKHLSRGPPAEEVRIPDWKKPQNEDEKLTRARLLYQSRKRGMLENGLLLSSFADQYLAMMTSNQLHQYDLLINKPSNDWDIYYWVTGNLETPADYDCEVMDLLKEHAKNTNKESRITQPTLKAR